MYDITNVLRKFLNVLNALDILNIVDKITYENFLLTNLRYIYRFRGVSRLKLSSKTFSFREKFYSKYIVPVT